MSCDQRFNFADGVGIKTNLNCGDNWLIIFRKDFKYDIKMFLLRDWRSN